MEKYNKDLVTKEYVNDLIKNICDILTNHINNKDNAHTIDDDSLVDIKDIFETTNDNNVVSLKNITTRDTEITIDDIALDANHKFISEDQIDEFSNKASKEELIEELEKYKADIRKELNEKFDHILNSKDILDKLKIISRALEDDEKLNTTLDSLVSSSKEILNEHVNDSVHLSTDDRIAINKLLKFINIGCADWDAKETEPNYIRNKPESFKANGGNADTIDNCKLEDIRNRQLERIIIGHDDRATYKLSKTALDKDCLETIYSVNNGIIGFTEDAFIISDIFKPKSKDIGELIFRGCGKGTLLNIDSFITSENITLENITLYGSNITVNSKTTFRNVNFVNCDITFSDNSNLIKIIDCDFNKNELHFNGSLFNSIIKDNIFKSTDFKFIGDSNIIKNNIFY